MIISGIAFYIFAVILTLSALMVITARNPVHSVLFLILAFFNSAGLFILLGAEFVGMIMVIVYVGAVAVLFLFVVMMLDISFANLRKGAMQYVPMGLLIGAVLLSELVLIYGAWGFVPGVEQNLAAPSLRFEGATNTESLGQILYTDYILAFQLAGLILFVAMIGAIVLTLRARPGLRKQVVAAQHRRKRKDVLEIHKVTPGTGG
ncbi:MAG: NADH-quinone oxidoreductase subunit J [Rhodospirillales bacterium]|nr:NADH-quinone oxidoreductase subunit J [Alphaproteobacteria bacterium]USO06117.1 MAG: NADH-quinone oxidoreductase subunit J [Rhodospirillales bacterium]